MAFLHASCIDRRAGSTRDTGAVAPKFLVPAAACTPPACGMLPRPPSAQCLLLCRTGHTEPQQISRAQAAVWGGWYQVGASCGTAVAWRLGYEMLKEHNFGRLLPRAVWRPSEPGIVDTYGVQTERFACCGPCNRTICRFGQTSRRLHSRTPPTWQSQSSPSTSTLLSHLLLLLDVPPGLSGVAPMSSLAALF